MFEYNVSKVADNNIFLEVCHKIEKEINDLNKKNKLIDVDGTIIQIYESPKGKIKVYNDYEVDAVYVESDLSLSGIVL